MSKEENCRVFSVFRPKSGTPLDYYIAKFDANSPVDFKNCTARMERENNFKEFKSIYGADTDMPTSGAGSEYGREKREEAKRKKFGFKAKQYDPKSQPFILKMGAGKDVKKMKGTKNGSVAKNTGYVAFVLTPQKHFVSLPVSDWYNFAPVSKRATISIEEAEEQFRNRDKIHNHFALMSDKKKDKREDDDEDFEGKPAKRQKRNRSENEIGTLSDSDEERDSDDDADDRKNKKRKRKEKSDDDETAEVGDEDEGVDEGKELDYLSDDSDDEDPVDENMDEINDFGQDDDEEQLGDDKSDDDDEEDSDIDGEKKDDSDSDSDDDIDGLFGGTSDTKESLVNDSISAAGKRKPDDPESNVKKPKLEANPVNNGKESLEDFVRDCLRKKPTSTSDLLRKVAPQFSKLFSMKELQQKLVIIMKKLSPQSRNIEGTMHFYL